jgi:hypothetical protein
MRCEGSREDRKRSANLVREEILCASMVPSRYKYGKMKVLNGTCWYHVVVIFYVV